MPVGSSSECVSRYWIPCFWTSVADAGRRSASLEESSSRQVCLQTGSGHSWSTFSWTRTPTGGRASYGSHLVNLESKGGAGVIANERQYHITKSRLGKIEGFLESYDRAEAEARAGSRRLARAELDAIKSEMDVLSTQIAEYELLKSGAVTVFEAESLEELPNILIRARISRGLTQRDLAERLGLKEQQVQRYESEAYASSSLTRLREIAAGLNLKISKIAELNPESASDFGTDVDWARFPIVEMYKRSWLGDFRAGVSAAKGAREELAAAFVQEAMPRRVGALLKHQVRAGSELDKYCLWAWQCRVLILARRQSTPVSFSRRGLSMDWLRELARQSRFEDGPRRVGAVLADVGIRLVIEPHLPHTYLDGAAFLMPSGPVIGMTLRYDRVDNFWFVLLHEVAHIWKHLSRDTLSAVFDDLEVEGDGIEREADSIAGNALVPEGIWESALARYVRTEEAVVDLARELEVSPAVIAGRIRREAENYVILKDLVGAGQVRPHFPEITFG